MTNLLEALHRGDDERVAELLAQQPALNVFEAAALGKAERVGEILAEDSSLANAYGDDGFQPLPLACFYGHIAAARLLLDQGADPNTLSRNEHIKTNALHAAAASEKKGPEARHEPCQSRTSASTCSSSKPHGLAKARSSSAQPRVPCRTASTNDSRISARYSWRETSL